MTWDTDLLPEQSIAASHIGTHARLMAGPGTGKTLTLTRHICFLISEENVSPNNILAVTFTRAASRELRQRVQRELGEEQCPRISTLHSFALRQLILNSKRIADLPQPLRIADDWEERNIILEDLKVLLGLRYVKDARDLLSDLSADWQSLTADEVDWERRFPNPLFIGSWREHRRIYGYTLRSELVYQLKKALEQRGDIEIEGPLMHLIVDEYQDLNRCDLAVVRQIALRNVELFIAGDDDQSIYGFRKAHPEGIRRFPRDYEGSNTHSLEICKRCDSNILDIGLFVAQQDSRRIPKAIRAETGREGGEVALLNFQNQEMEAEGIAGICSYLIRTQGLQPDNILILIRSDHDGVFSIPIIEALKAIGIPVSKATDMPTPLDTDNGRSLLAFLRLAVSPEDSLSWRTLLQVWCEGIGSGAINVIEGCAHTLGKTFAQVILLANSDPSILPSNYRSRICKAIRVVLDLLSEFFSEDHEMDAEVMEVVRRVAKSLIEDNGEREYIINELESISGTALPTSIEEFIRATEITNEDIEQDIEEGNVNILTMHRAKGLSSEAVIIMAAEDQYIPGRAEGDAVDDERRLLFVSLTRAKHYLFVTYCDERTGRQTRTGRPAGKDPNTGKDFWTKYRSFTRFLVDATVDPQPGRIYVRNL